MPKLLMFAPCEKVLIDQDNNASLISVIQDLKVEIPEQVDLEQGLPVVAVRWTALAIWLKTDADAAAAYEQRLALFDPSGKPTGIDSRTTFSFEDKLTIRNLTIVSGFPVHASGRYVLRLWIHAKGQTESVEPVAEYPINLNREQPKAKRVQ